MTDFKEISDLRPAPRRTPTSVLWLMATTVIVGTGVLVFFVPGNDGDAAAQSVRTRATFAASPTQVARAPTSSKQAASPHK